MSGNSPIPKIKIEVTLPKEYSSRLVSRIELTLTGDAINRTWIQILQKHKRRVYNFLMRNPGKYAVQGWRNRSKTFALNSSIKDYINAIKRKPVIYKPGIVKKRPRNRTSVHVPSTEDKRVRSSFPGGMPPGHEGNGSTVTRVGASNPTPSESGTPATTRDTCTRRFQRNGSSLGMPPSASPSVLTTAHSGDSSDSDDSALASDYQREQRDIRGERSKREFLNNLANHVDNLALQDMKQELQGIIRRGGWARLSGKAPHTFGVLPILLELSFALDQPAPGQ